MAAGDINGDGYADLLIEYAVPITGTEFNFSFRVEVHLGGSAGLGSATTVIAAPMAGQSNLDAIALEDVDGDGYLDAVMGVYNQAVYVYAGGPAGVPLAPTATLVPIPADLSFASDLANAGDVNGDGYADVVVAAYVNYSVGPSHVYLYAGSATGLSMPPTEMMAPATGTYNDRGYAVAGAGDLNGDGYSDFVVSALGSTSGVAMVYLGGPGLLTVTPAIVLVAPVPDEATDGSAFANALGSAGDFDGDGRADLAIGSPYAPAINTGSGYIAGVGQAYVYPGGATGVPTVPSVTLLGPTPPGAGEYAYYFGGALITAGDLNGDGYEDLVVAAPSVGAYEAGGISGEGAGAIYVYFGSATGVPTVPSQIRTSPDMIATNNFGYYMACAPLGERDVHIHG